ncbi:MAG: hypothetical protein ACOY31_12820 [Bacillota bacterium]
MHVRPVLLVQSDGPAGDGLIHVIAVYSGEAPVSVTTRRIFQGETSFRFPTEVSEGVTKTRVVYSYTLEQWREILETCTMPGAHGGLKQVMIPLAGYFRKLYPGQFEEIECDRDYDPDDYAEIIEIKE